MKKHRLKTSKHIIIIVVTGLIILSLILIIKNRLIEQNNLSKPVEFGVSYSPDYAAALGLDPQKTYLDILGQLNTKSVRLNAYWDQIEPQPNKFDFSDLDYYVQKAAENQVSVLLTVGYKLPRWPECRAPKWLDTEDKQLRKSKQLQMVQAVISHYENNPAISAFQLENEPLLEFGTCPPPDLGFLEKEVAFARTLTQKPIILTDSGELSSWIMPMRLSNYFGTTLYRIVYNEYVGFLPYPLQPWFYRTKGILVNKIFAPQNKGIMVIELQGEPWTPSFITEVPIEQQVKQFPVEQFKNNIDFARKVGFQTIYLWGVEWWYWMKTQNHPEYWNYIINIMAKP